MPPARGLPYDFDVTLGFEQRGESGPEQILIVDDQYTDHARCRSETSFMRLSKASAAPVMKASF